MGGVRGKDNSIGIMSALRTATLQTIMRIMMMKARLVRKRMEPQYPLIKCQQVALDTAKEMIIHHTSLLSITSLVYLFPDSNKNVATGINRLGVNAPTVDR